MKKTIRHYPFIIDGLKTNIRDIQDWLFENGIVNGDGFTVQYRGSVGSMEVYAFHLTDADDARAFKLRWT